MIAAFDEEIGDTRQVWMAQPGQHLGLTFELTARFGQSTGIGLRLRRQFLYSATVIAFLALLHEADGDGAGPAGGATSVCRRFLASLAWVALLNFSEGPI